MLSCCPPSHGLYPSPWSSMSNSKWSPIAGARSSIEPKTEAEWGRKLTEQGSCKLFTMICLYITANVSTIFLLIKRLVSSRLIWATLQPDASHKHLNPTCWSKLETLTKQPNFKAVGRQKPHASKAQSALYNLIYDSTDKERKKTMPCSVQSTSTRRRRLSSGLRSILR